MRRLSITSWALLLAVAVLGGYVYVTEIRGADKESRRKDAASKLLSIPVSAITEVNIERSGMRISCVKAAGVWRIISPIQAQADDTAVLKLLDDLETAHVDRTLGSQESAAAYGLDRPRVITVRAGGHAQVLEVGKQNPTGEFVFARRRPDHTILLVDRKAAAAADRSLLDLREKALFSFTPDDVTRVEFKSPSGMVRLSRWPEGGGWRVALPRPVTADRGKVERSLDLLSTLRAEDFIREDGSAAARYGLAPPAASARFELKGQQPEALLVGRRTVQGALTRYFAMRQTGGPIFTINENLPRDAMQPASEWRDRHVTDFAVPDVAELRLITPERALICSKSSGPGGDEWRIAEFAGSVGEGMNLAAAAKLPTAVVADEERVKNILNRLATLEVSSFEDPSSERPAPPQPSRPALRVVVRDAAGKELASASFSPAVIKGKWRGASSHLGVAYLVPAADLQPFRSAFADLARRR